MNYRHAFHAGNFADVHKHVVLLAILRHLLRKDSAFAVLDTHAGRGDYALREGASARTGEYLAGIGALWEATDAPAPVADYLLQVRAWNRQRTHDDALAVYPGSPRLARGVLRAQDRLMACEIQPEECALLRANFRNDTQVAVHARDGWEALRALLPPKEKRGLVLVDPPYEDQERELFGALRHLEDAQRRFGTGILALWYPIKERALIRQFHREVVDAFPGARVLASELCVLDDDNRLQLNGSGMLLVNPPWQLDVQLREALPWLHARLAEPGQGRADTLWLCGSE
jgi:23S rRNA (adenine2030-N6)-methyltransferase